MIVPVRHHRKQALAYEVSVATVRSQEKKMSNVLKALEEYEKLPVNDRVDRFNGDVFITFVVGWLSGKSIAELDELSAVLKPILQQQIAKNVGDDDLDLYLLSTPLTPDTVHSSASCNAISASSISSDGSDASNSSTCDVKTTAASKDEAKPEVTTGLCSSSSASSSAVVGASSAGNVSKNTAPGCSTSSLPSTDRPININRNRIMTATDREIYLQNLRQSMKSVFREMPKKMSYKCALNIIKTLKLTGITMLVALDLSHE